MTLNCEALFIHLNFVPNQVSCSRENKNKRKGIMC